MVVSGDLSREGALREHAVVGETPNLAARLQSLAEPGTNVVAASTRRLLGDLFRLRDLGRHELKGIAEPVAAWAARRYILWALSLRRAFTWSEPSTSALC